MATKTINTRIKNKVAELSSWNSATGTLLNGEIAIVRVPTGDTYTNPVTGVDEPVVELLMKVGDGTSAFADLPWLSAKASDVYNWAKKGTATEVPVTVNGTASTLGAYLAKVDTNASNISANTSAITKLNGSNTTAGSVAKAIKDAIDALDVSTSSGSGNFVKAVTQSNGKISVTKGTIAESELPSISTDKVYLAGAASTTLTTKLGTMDAAIAEKMDIHTHPYLPDTTTYAGSSSKGGAATSANKVNKSLTVKLNGGSTEDTNLFTFNGSAAKSINITPSAIGAAASSHSHNDVYYTESEIDAKVLELNNSIDGKAASGHNHDDKYITPSAVDTKISTALGSVLKYKGTKADTSSLPTSGNATGDVWNITAACAANSEKSLPAVNAGDNVAWNGTGWDVLAGTVDLSSYYTETEVNALLAEKSDTGHTHKYAGSSSAGGAANSVKTSLTFKNDGSGAASGTTFNGSTARTISYNTIGAAAASHTHTKSEITDFAHNHDDVYYTETEVNALLAEKSDTHSHPYLSNTVKYAGSATQGGAANSVANSIKVQLNGGTTEGTDQFTFNGSAAKTVNVTAGGVGAYTKAETDALLATKQASGSYAASSHAHGNITTDGKITATAVTAASGVVVVDSNNKVQRVTDMSKVRSIIGAGTSSLTLGTTSSTAAKGNHTHSGYESQLTAIESNYVRFANDKLYVGKDGADEIIFDCGGAPV